MNNQKQLTMFLVLVVLVLQQSDFGLAATLVNENGHPASSLSSWMGKKPAVGLTTGMWFGPRMGRRLKRNPKEELGYFNMNRDELNALAELIQENPWAVIASVPEGQKRQMNFTPRLGRDSGEEGGQASSGSDRWLQEDLAMASGDVIGRSPPFAPRLGRRAPGGLPFGRYA